MSKTPTVLSLKTQMESLLLQRFHAHILSSNESLDTSHIPTASHTCDPSNISWLALHWFHSLFSIYAMQDCKSATDLHV